MNLSVLFVLITFKNLNNEQTHIPLATYHNFATTVNLIKNKPTGDGWMDGRTDGPTDR